MYHVDYHVLAGEPMTLSQLNCTKSVHNVSKILHPIKYIKHMKPPKKNDS